MFPYPRKRLLYLFCDIQDAGEKKMDSKENGLGNKRSESFSGQNHICNRLSLSDLSWEMRSPGDRGLELRPVWLEWYRCWESSVLRGQLSGRERVGDTAETKPSGPPASKRRCEEERWVKQAEGFSRRRGGQAPWRPWKQQGERMLGGRRGIISHAKGCRGF